MSVILRDETNDQRIERAVLDFDRQITNLSMGGFDTGRAVVARLGYGGTVKHSMWRPNSSETQPKQLMSYMYV